MRFPQGNWVEKEMGTFKSTGPFDPTRPMYPTRCPSLYLTLQEFEAKVPGNESQGTENIQQLSLNRKFSESKSYIGKLRRQHAESDGAVAKKELKGVGSQLCG